MPRPGFKPGPKNPKWRGDDAGCRAIHDRLITRRGKARDHTCIDCGQPARHWSYQGGCTSEKPRRLDAEGRVISSPYCVHPEHYVPRCISDHARHDGIIENVRKTVERQAV